MNEGNIDAQILQPILDRLRKAQKTYAAYAQEEVDRIFQAAAMAANRNRIPLAKMAVKETGMGLVEDKVIKNHFACEYIYNAYKDTKTCDVVQHDEAAGFTIMAEPVGLIAALTPITNPTSTVIFKCLLALKTRNAILICPHPKAVNCSIAAAKIILEAAVAAGAPENIIGWILDPTPARSGEAMALCDLTLATGGPGMVKAAYSSGKPAIGVGPGNTPALVDETADIPLAVNSIIHSKVFDNGMICASEQSVIIPRTIYDAAVEEFTRRGCHLLTEEEMKKMRQLLFQDGKLNAAIVGQSACAIAKMADISVPPYTKILIGQVVRTDPEEPFAREKLSPVLAMYCAADFADGLRLARELVEHGGLGHTASVFLNTEKARERLEAFSRAMKTCRVLVNTPAAQGGIGDLYNFRLAPSLTLGCGSWGGNSVSENVGISHLLNYKKIVHRRENMLWFQTPEKVYIKRGCLDTALNELKDVMGKKRAFLVTDAFLYESGQTQKIEKKLEALGITHTTFWEVSPDPTLSCALAGAKKMAAFVPDVILGIGGGSAMDAAKIMWVLYEHPQIDFQNLTMRFADIRKRIYHFPKMGGKADFVAIPTTAGTGSEVTPFAVITDGETGIKYPLAGYALMPKMAIVDANMMMHAPKSLTAATGIDAVTHALEAYSSVMATEFTDALALQALKDLFQYLPRAYTHGSQDPIAREKTAHAATMAGMAFANGFLGICHSMAHKLGAFHHIPHGIANALLISHVIRFNAEEIPTRMATFPQYAYPHTLQRYATLATALGLPGDGDEEKLSALLDHLEALKSMLEIHKTIADYGIREADFLEALDEMAEQAFDDQCTGANPRYPTIDQIKEIYCRAYYGAW